MSFRQTRPLASAGATRDHERESGSSALPKADVPSLSQMRRVPTGRKIEKRSKSQPAGRIEQLSDLLHQLDSRRDDERKLLSRDLHDTLVASLSATKMECDYLLRSGASAGMEAELKRRVARVSNSLGEAIHYTRRVIDQLWPTAVDHLGLSSALRSHVEELRSSSGLAVSTDVDGELGELPEAYSMMLYRAGVEALDFCARHHPPLRPDLRVRRTDAGIELTIESNGPARDDGSESAPFDVGMIRERALHLGGEFALGDSRGAQFQLRIFLPLSS